MTQGNKIEWEVDQLKKNVESLDKKVDKNDEKINNKVDAIDEKVDNLESFRDTTIQQIKTLILNVQNMQDSFKWMNRFFITTVIGGIATIVITIISRLSGGG